MQEPRGYSRSARFPASGQLRGAPRRALIIALVWAILLAGLAAVARGQDPVTPPGDAVPSGDLCTEENADVCDTPVTPVPHESEAWVRVAGADYPETTIDPEHTSTPISVNFFSVDFRNEQNGFAVGAGCVDPDEDFADLDDCERVPVIYQYTQPPGEVAQWTEVYRGTTKGYVGSVAWIGPGRALAVGGDGIYPRREQAAGDPDPAGMARAWLYAGGNWTEVTDLPAADGGEPMRGFTTVDCSPRAEDGELCYAGAYQQLWKWEGGAFTESFTNASPEDRLGNAADLRFRIREVRFHPDRDPADIYPANPRIFAVTSGCCAADRQENVPRLLAFEDRDTGTNVLYGWRVRPLLSTGAGGASEDLPVDRQTAAESYYAINVTPRDAFSVGAPHSEALSVVASPAQPDGQTGPELASQVLGGIPPNGRSSATATDQISSTVVIASAGSDPNLSTMRLLSGDGDFLDRPSADPSTLEVEPKPHPDGLVDWAVGELRSGQGVGFATFEQATPVASLVDCPNDSLTAPGDCRPGDPEEATGEARSEALIALPSYGLNSLRFVPDSAIGWAVGDKGAILRLGGEGTVGSVAAEPDPPDLGAPSPDESDSSAYDDLTPAASDAETGPVPPLASRDPAPLPRGPGLVGYGAPDPTHRDVAGEYEEVGTFVMSRDGGEGWAIGPGLDPSNFQNPEDGDTQLSLYRFDGARWGRCDTQGAADRLPADPACEELGPLVDAGVDLLTATRVPLELDDDPTNDDEFEVVALGSAYKPPGFDKAVPAVVRYSDGRWRLDERAMREVAALGTDGFKSIAFTAPDDGWALARSGPATVRLLHYDGERWTACNDPVESPTQEANDATLRAACGDPDGRVPLENLKISNAQLGLTVAGERLYIYANRLASGTLADQLPSVANTSATSDKTPTFPAILYKDPGGNWSADADGGGYDPGFNPEQTGDEDQGLVCSVSVIRSPTDGTYSGWAVGRFGTSPVQDPEFPVSCAAPATRAVVPSSVSTSGEVPLLRLADGAWERWLADDAARDYLGQYDGVLTVIGPDGERSFLKPRAAISATRPTAPPLAFDTARNSWEVQPAPFLSRFKSGIDQESREATVRAMAPDNRGGFWLAARQALGKPGPRITHIYRYADEAPAEVFTDVPHPVREGITGVDAAADATVWVSTDSAFVYRYRRTTGWERFNVPGWDPGRFTTSPSSANAIAVGPDGRGLVVGEGGRIAKLAPDGVRLDRAAGAAACSAGLGAPCGTGRDLEAVAVAPDGSALAAGEARALLWRPPGGDFRAVTPPTAPLSATFTAVSMPAPGHAWLTTDGGQVWGGDLTGSDWAWRLENANADGELLSLGAGGGLTPLRAIEIDSSGRGLAVGDEGLVLERTGDAAAPWRRLLTGYTDNLRSVVLPANGHGGGALVGGDHGLILTRADGRFEVARPADNFSPLTTERVHRNPAQIAGLALLPGGAAGQVEAWAASQVPDADVHRNPRPQALLHYTSAPDDPLLDGASGLDPLPDSAAATSDELTFGALGRSECQFFDRADCPEMQGTALVNEVVAQRAVDELLATDDLDFTLFTGDIARAAGEDHGFEDSQVGSVGASTPAEINLMHHRWSELVAERFDDAHMPLFGAIGGRDLTQARVCQAAGCADPVGQAGGAGSAEAWRLAMAGRAPPWGDGPAASTGSFDFVPVGGDGGAAGQASTHYAVDIVDKASGARLARLVVADTSLRSLDASDPNQNPQEAQAAWLEHVLCFDGSSDDVEGVRDCTRERGQEAIVLTNTPTYTYSSRIDPTQVQPDAALFETTLLRYDATVAVTGRLGWNGLYYALAPGLHCPEPGGAHPDPSKPPAPGAAGCDEDAQTIELPEEVAGETPTGALPFVVASTAGGRFGPNGDVAGSAGEGFWDGYTVVRVRTRDDLPADEPRVLVEQRPVFEWIGVDAKDHTLNPRGNLTLEGYGREVAGIDAPLRYDDISTNAITHRYDLVLADQDQPWLPCLASDPACVKLQSLLAAPPGQPPHPVEHNACDPYLCVPERVGTVDRTSGRVNGGDGRYPRTFALGVLSVGARAASWPLVFERAPSFIVTPLGAPQPLISAVPGTPATPNPTNPSTPVEPPPPPPPPAPPSIPQPKIPQLNLPPPPVLPTLPLLGVAEPPLPTPPPPPAPPPPAQHAAALTLSVSAAGLSVATPATVIQPPTPPVNPAPPSGARREARQRQAAAQKSGADAEEGSDGVDPQDAQGTVNKVESSQQAATRRATGGGRQELPATRRDRVKPGPSFSALEPRDQPSAWATGALYTGGITLMALFLALGWNRARPTPRRREPELPAPAWVRSDRGSRLRP